MRPRKYSDDAILEAAREVFLEHGVSASTTLVADAVGLSQAALFKRFGTKEELLRRALLPAEPFAWLTALQAGPGDGPLRDQLVAIAVEASAFFDRMLPCLMTLSAAGLDHRELLSRFDEPPPLRARRVTEAFFAAAVADGRLRPVDCATAANTFVGAIQSDAAMRHMFGEPAPTDAERRRRADALVDLLWGGLAPTSEPR